MRRRVFGEYQSSDPSRFLAELPADLVERVEPNYAPSWGGRPGGGYGGGYGGGAGRYRQNQYGRGGVATRNATNGSSRSTEAGPAYKYEDEDQSGDASGLKLGMNVRHAQFGVGTVIGIDPAGDDTKLTVRFASVGAKKLIARFARLTPA